MRDIRFRIYDKSKKKMFYKTLIGIWGNWEDVKDDENYTSCAVYDECWKHVEPYMDDIELMQFTGLYDKNKVPIYEGDILGYRDCEDKMQVDGVVKYGEFNCSCCNGVYGWYVDGGDIRANDLHEVIGNIYENSDLLGE